MITIQQSSLFLLILLLVFSSLSTDSFVIKSSSVSIRKNDNVIIKQQQQQKQQQHQNHFHYQRLSRREAAKKSWDPPPSESISDEGGENIEDDKGLAFSLELSKRAGISWGSDLSFRWIYVLDLEPNGEAASTGLIQKGDYIIGFGNTSLIAQDFDFVLTTLNQQESRLNYTFFRGTKEQLLGGPVQEPSDMTVTVTVKQDGKPDVKLQCPGGTNLRRLLVGNGINVYRSLTRWTNCNGKQRCGTCIVDIEEGNNSCSRRALDEEFVLRENPVNYRLSCVTSVYGDVTVRVGGPVGAAQWTR